MKKQIKYIIISILIITSIFIKVKENRHVNDYSNDITIYSDDDLNKDSSYN